MNDAALFNFLIETDLKDYTLIIPSVSVGNVPQLTIDVIISSYHLERTATIWHPGIIPSVGANPFNGTHEVCTACELYTNKAIKLAVLQLRSALDQKYASQFFADLHANLLQFELKNVIILASIFAHEMHDVTSSKYIYLSNDFGDETFGKFNVEKVDEDCGFHGAGFAKKLYDLFSMDMKMTLLIRYTSEGDNRPDAMQMMDLLMRILKSSDDAVRIEFPVSWNYVFGNAPPIGMY